MLGEIVPVRSENWIGLNSRGAIDERTVAIMSEPDAEISRSLPIRSDSYRGGSVANSCMGNEAPCDFLLLVTPPCRK
jgi:hypothetical protein